MLSGPQIDPGFHGVLSVGVSNLSPQDIVFPYKDPFLTIEFYKLSDPVLKPYQGEAQGQTGISAAALHALVAAPGMTFGQVITALQGLTQNVSQLSASVSMLDRQLSDSINTFTLRLTIGFAIFGLLITIIQLLGR